MLFSPFGILPTSSKKAELRGCLRDSTGEQDP
jgi:hypothetical protein